MAAAAPATQEGAPGPTSTASITYDPEAGLFHLAPHEGADKALVAEFAGLLNAAAAMVSAETGRAYWLPPPHHRRASRKRERN